jgi:hypothetical protein
MLILQDKLLMTRLQSHPEFALRLQEVITTWNLEAKPGLYVQARPVSENRKLDVDAPALRAVLNEGAQEHERWWDSLSAPLVFRSVHGITGLTDAAQPNWLVEVHRDGHLLAGVWDFPTAPTADGESAVIPDWYSKFFEQFMEVTGNLMSAVNQAGDFQVTATLVNADALRFATTRGGGTSLLGSGCRQKNVQWLVRTAAVGTDGWTGLGQEMAHGLRGAYRVRPR